MKTFLTKKSISIADILGIVALIAADAFLYGEWHMPVWAVTLITLAIAESVLIGWGLITGDVQGAIREIRQWRASR